MKSTTVAIIIAGLLIAGSILYSSSGRSGGETPSVDNVSLVGGKQIIDIVAGGGYSPRLTRAKAGIATTLRLSSRTAFDCSTAVRIPSLNFGANLTPDTPASVELPPQTKGSTLQGMCAMGMYRFAIEFE